MNSIELESPPFSSAGTEKPETSSWKMRWHAAANARTNRRHEYAVARYKDALFGALRGEVIELGPGAGTNLVYFSRDVRWIGVEPNPFLHRYMKDRAKRLDRTIELQLGSAERIDAPSESVDAVAGSFVLCSVGDVSAALSEIKRVLRPGGAFVFVEHVAAAGGTAASRAQKIVGPIHRWFGGGCHMDRRLWNDILGAGFADVRIEHISLPITTGGPHIAGFALKQH
jgi:ubiquinone/menaquinone biosynthesis C-methylase UbiE